ncbi:MAG: hypothetical protein GY895_18550, partial [Phycisphaera sp.]|nr:hypothetical protein [Phycisphaera sp.]
MKSLPESLGEFSDGYVNWGPGIIGNAFHDGGLWMAAIYGLVVGGVFRIFDDLLRRQPSNPWLIAMLAAMSPKLVAYSRGDIAVYTVELLGLAILFIVVLKITGLAFGSTEEDEFNVFDDDDGEWDHVDETALD